MQAIIIEGTEDTPKVTLDKQNSTYLISGRSLPEDVTAFYQPVLEWLDIYALDPADEMVLDIKLEYFNTASSKLILDILLKLEEISEKGKKIEVNWHHDKDDDDMKEAGEEYAEIVTVSVNFIEY